jgi:integrase/nucleoid DNA-binding protein
MPTVREAALAWWEEKKKEIFPHEHSYYKNFLDYYILRFLGDDELSSLTESRMDSYFTQVLFEQTYRNSVGRKNVAYGKPILHSVLDFAEERGMANNLPKADLTFRLNKKKTIVMNGCEYSAEIIEQIKTMINMERTSYAGLALGFAWYAGLTREEMLSLSWGQLDFENNLIRYGEERLIWLEEPLKEMLSLYKSLNDINEKEYIFISRKKTRFAGPSISLLVKEAKEKYRIEDESVNLNALRNNYIINKLQTIPTEDLPFLAQALDVSPISLINRFANYLTPTENELKGVNGFYQRDNDYWIAQLKQEGLSYATVDTLLNAISKVIANALNKGECVSIEDLGLFYLKKSPERYERNILTLEFYKAPEEHQLAFVPYPKLLFNMNFFSDY